MRLYNIVFLPLSLLLAYMGSPGLEHQIAEKMPEKWKSAIQWNSYQMPREGFFQVLLYSKDRLYSKYEGNQWRHCFWPRGTVDVICSLVLVTPSERKENVSYTHNNRKSFHKPVMVVCSEAELSFSANSPPLLPLSKSFSKNLLVIEASKQLKDLDIWKVIQASRLTTNQF